MKDEIRYRHRRTRTKATALVVRISFCLVILWSTAAAIGHAQPPSEPQIPGKNDYPGVTGKVYDQTHAILPGVSVRVRGIQPPRPERTIQTDESGTYFVPCLEDGLYEITFSLEGFFETSARFDYLYPMNRRIDQILSLSWGGAPDTINYRIVDKATRLPIGGATVEVEELEYPLETDDCGRTWGAKVGENTITVHKAGYKTERRRVVLRANERISLLFELEPDPD